MLTSNYSFSLFSVMGVISRRKNNTRNNVLKNIHKLIFLLLGDCGTGV